MKSTREIDGILVVDKPSGMTSHDVVARARRLLGTRRVGHAGTLDPMATGVLVVLAGEATKLAAHLTAHDKRYEARVTFGAATDTLDAEGTTIATAEVPAWLTEEIAQGGRAGRLAEAIAGELARREQVPPAFSAIQVDGERSYDRARKGEAVSLPPRPVEARAIRVIGGGERSVDLDLEVSKGYYVRSLARDLGERLGVPAHLSALRRTASGCFGIARAIALDAGAEALRAALVPMARAAAEALPVGRLTAEGTVRARQGKRLSEQDFTVLPPSDDDAAWLDPEGSLVAIGARVRDASATDPAANARTFAVVRGFVA
jgi:tRNA pseudouridine55 synthase